MLYYPILYYNMLYYTVLYYAPDPFALAWWMSTALLSRISLTFFWLYNIYIYIYICFAACIIVCFLEDLLDLRCTSRSELGTEQFIPSPGFRNRIGINPPPNNSSPTPASGFTQVEENDKIYVLTKKRNTTTYKKNRKTTNSLAAGIRGWGEVFGCW